MGKYTDFFRNKKCDILGMGISNTPLAEMLAESGAIVTVHDKKQDISEFGDVGERLKSLGCGFVLGEGNLCGIDGDYVFRSPGVKPFLPEICAARDRGAVITSEMEWFIENTPATVIGITGSDGKTTTTTLVSMIIERMLKRRGRGKMYLGGNIGKPLLPQIDGMTADDFAIVELSSFQLMTLKKSPARAVITNLSPNHLDWHRSMEEYIEAKTNIYRNPGCGLLVTNAENQITSELAAKCKLPVILFSSKRGESEVPAVVERDGVICYVEGDRVQPILKTEDILLPGRHNVENYMAAIAVTYGLADFDIITDIAKNFGGVEHRLEFVRELNGVRYINSSIDSSPTRTAAALSALKEKPIVICCGKGKNLPLEPLAKVLCERAKSVVLSGGTRDEIFKALNDYKGFDPELLPVKILPDFTDAVKYASSIAQSGDTVLLSPAGTSFDAFKNFEERGRRFKEIVNSL